MMRNINKTAIVPYSAQNMYDLVNSIEEYPQFLPWCSSSTVLSRDSSEVKASIVIQKGAFQYSFSTINRLEPNQRIEVRLMEGPFKHLEGLWQFEDMTNGGCSIKFDLEFEFKNKLLSLTAGPILQKIAESFMDAFIQRAKHCYADPN